MPYLKFITDADLIQAIGNVIQTTEMAEDNIDSHLHKNVLDPFSAIFEGVTHDLSYPDWIALEKTRQIQKTMQNAIGNFHQEILGSINGWTNLGIDGGLDVANKDLHIIAEVKNKFNTTKGNHKPEIYDAIKSKLSQKEYLNYTGYFVEIIPKKHNKYNIPYTPADNKTKQNRPVNSKIRVIDGVSFYAMATDRENALLELFEAIPLILINVFEYKLNPKEAIQYHELFKRAFSTE